MNNSLPFLIVYTPTNDLDNEFEYVLTYRYGYSLAAGSYVLTDTTYIANAKAKALLLVKK